MASDIGLLQYGIEGLGRIAPAAQAGAQYNAQFGEASAREIDANEIMRAIANGEDPVALADKHAAMKTQGGLGASRPPTYTGVRNLTAEAQRVDAGVPYSASPAQPVASMQPAAAARQATPMRRDELGRLNEVYKDAALLRARNRPSGSSYDRFELERLKSGLRREEQAAKDSAAMSRLLPTLNSKEGIARLQASLKEKGIALDAAKFKDHLAYLYAKLQEAKTDHERDAAQSELGDALRFISSMEGTQGRMFGQNINAQMGPTDALRTGPGAVPQEAVQEAVKGAVNVIQGRTKPPQAKTKSSTSSTSSTTIRVRVKQTGQTGSIPSNEFDSALYERL